MIDYEESLREGNMSSKSHSHERKLRSITGHELKRKKKLHKDQVLEEHEVEDQIEFGIQEYEQTKELG